MKAPARPRTFAALVRAAGPEARQLLLSHGIDARLISSSDNRWDAAARVAGHTGPNIISDADQELQNEYTEAFFALGIAIGQLVHPDVFKTSGAK